MYVAESKRLTHEGARKMMATAVDMANQAGIAISCTIVDSGGHMILFERMDGGRFWPIFWHLMLPMARPMLLVALVLQVTSIWNDYLLHSGLAGSFVSMPCYVIAAICIFLSARRLTQSSSVSFIGTLVFILNPNVLYLQSIPLSETVCIATSALTAYFFLCWVQDGKLQQMILVAICAFFATLSRYDGWALFVGVFFCLVFVGLMKRQGWHHIRANLVVFGVLGSLGIVLWFLWNKAIFGDPLYFQKGLYSSQSQQSQELTV